MIRTTLSIQDSLFEKLKNLSSKKRKTLSDTTNEILSDFFRPKKNTIPYHFRWKVVKGDRIPSVDPADRDQLYQFLDENK